MRKYKAGREYAYLLTFSYNPPPMSPGTSKIASVAGTVMLKDNKTALEMMNYILSYVKKSSGIEDDTVVFPFMYHVEEN